MLNSCTFWSEIQTTKVLFHSAKGIPYDFYVISSSLIGLRFQTDFVPCFNLNINLYNEHEFRKSQILQINFRVHFVNLTLTYFFMSFFSQYLFLLIRLKKNIATFCLSVMHYRIHVVLAHEHPYLKSSSLSSRFLVTWLRIVS